jgi:hypothetical protein
MPLATTGLRLRRSRPAHRQRTGSMLALCGLVLICLAAAVAAVLTHPFA